MREVDACAYASHGQGRIIPGRLWHMKVAPGGHVSGARGRFSPKHWNLSAPASGQAVRVPGDAMWTPGSQQAHHQQVVVAARQRGQPVGGQPPPNGYS